MATLTVYGIPNCDKVRKTRRYLDKHAIDYHFHDFRQDGLTVTKLKSWCKRLNWETLLNRRGTSYRNLPDNKKANINQQKALQLMLENPTLIKRPVIEYGKQLLLGFSESDIRNLLG